MAVSINHVILDFSLLEFLSPLGLLSSYCLSSPVLVHLPFMVLTLQNVLKASGQLLTSVGVSLREPSQPSNHAPISSA